MRRNLWLTVAAPVLLFILLAPLAFGQSSDPPSPKIAGVIWGISTVSDVDKTGLTSTIQAYDGGTGKLLFSFKVPCPAALNCNGRGLASEGGNLWYTVLTGRKAGTGDGKIHQIAPGGKADIKTIPDPYGVRGRGIGALDFDGDSLWAISYLPSQGFTAPPGPNDKETVFKIDSTNNCNTKACNVVASCDVLYNRAKEFGGADTLEIDGKTFLTNAGEADITFLDRFNLPTKVNEGACTAVGALGKCGHTYCDLPVGVGGADFDDNGNLAVSSAFASTISNLGKAPFDKKAGDTFPTTLALEDITITSAGIVPCGQDIGVKVGAALDICPSTVPEFAPGWGMMVAIALGGVGLAVLGIRLKATSLRGISTKMKG